MPEQTPEKKEVSKKKSVATLTLTFSFLTNKERVEDHFKKNMGPTSPPKKF